MSLRTRGRERVVIISDSVLGAADGSNSQDYGLSMDADLHVDPQASNEAPLPPANGQSLEVARHWRAAESLKVLKRQVDAAYPGRDFSSDGMVGDLRHQAGTSDHNPHIIDGAVGVVSAFDITHDPIRGCDAGRIVATLHASRDPRIKYIIWKRSIANSSPIGGAPAWAWRAYTGANPHSRHCHISVKATKAFYDDPSPWTIPIATEGATEAAEATAPTEVGNGLADIEMALAALGGTNGKPLFQALVDAQDAISVLLSRYAEETSEQGQDSAELEASRPDFAQISAEYLQLFASCRINPSRLGEVAWHRTRLLKNRPRYEEVSARTGVPWWFVGIVHALEASFNFAGHLHNGDPLTSRTVQVPQGRPAKWNPPSDWVSSAVDAIKYEGYAGISDWSLAITLFRFETYNGFGYRGRDMNTPYLWSFSNHYSRGKFVRDRRFDPTAVSRQCGAAVMLKALAAAGDISIIG